jgi:hypothetical protein
MGSIFPNQNPVGRPGIDDGHGCSSSIGRGVRAMLMPSSSADALLFDLGRVVIDIDFNRAFSRWAEHARCDQKLIRERLWHDDTAYKRSAVRPTANTSSTGQSSFPAFSAISKRSTCRRQLGCESPKPRRTTMLSGQSAYRQTVLCSLTIAVKTLREHEPGDCRLFT